MGHFPIICKSVSVKTVNRVLEIEDAFSPTFVAAVTAPTYNNTSMTKPATNHQTGSSDPGWHAKIQDQEILTWCIDTGWQNVCDAWGHQPVVCGTLSKSDGGLVGAGDVTLVTLGCAVMNLTQAEAAIKKRLYVVRGASYLLPGVPAIRSIGLFHEIRRTYSVKAVNIIKCLITIHSNQGQRRTFSSSIRRSFKAWANWRVSIQLKKGATPFCLSTPMRVPRSLTKKVLEEIKRMEQLEVSLPRIPVYCYVSAY